ncbi:MAG: LuxR C-terminal-related transcriptional regulator [Sphaerochaetaceae bacterium]|nr:LuxR C-terminal-related transcriptional regulator [Sphaerochaetaceae bacterium]MDY0371379.1 LuxR C-terminal-related transcriptional regulator [Sphaerochaetaceae bacterium]
MNKKHLLVTASTHAMLETFRYWILSFLKNEVVLETFCFTESERMCSHGDHFDLSIALLFEAYEIEVARSVLKELEMLDYHLGTTMVVLSSALQKQAQVIDLQIFTRRVPLATCMHHIVSELRSENHLFVHEIETSFKAFTQREKQVLELLAQGIGIKEIAHTLGISKYTVITYQRNLYLKTGARTLQQLALFAAMHVHAVR